MISQKSPIGLKSEITLKYARNGAEFSDHAKYSEAIYCFTKAISLESDIADFYRRRGLAHSELRQLDEAISDLTKNIELESDEPLNFVNRALVYRKYGKHDLAVEDLTWYLSLIQANNQTPKRMSFIYGFRAESYLELQQYEKAIDDATIAIAFTPNNRYILNIRRKANKMLQRLDDVINDLLLLKKINPEDIYVDVYLAKEYYCNGQYDLAKKCIDEYFSKDESFGTAYLIRSFINRHFGTPIDVGNDLQKAIALGDEDAGAVLDEYVKIQLEKEEE